MSQGLVAGSPFIRSMGVQFRLLEDGRIGATFAIAEAQQGPPGYAHGGALAAVIDEAMGAASWFAGNRGLSVHLSFDYKHPVPVGAPVSVTAQVERREGRKVFTSAAVVLPDGTVAVSGSGVYVDAPQLLAETSGFRILPVK